jgi:glycosyltransferase involved in cell wall biosynthesis
VTAAGEGGILDVLIPTYARPAALAVTLGGMVGQVFGEFRVVVSDQTEVGDVLDSAEVRAVIRTLEMVGRPVVVHKHLPVRGMAEQRQFLLDQATARYALFLDDDVILEPDVVQRLVAALEEEGCGFVGMGLIGPSFVTDVRPAEQAVQFWDGRVVPERVRPGTAQWQRARLHNAANLHHVQQRLCLSGTHTYRVAWVGGCVLYDTAKLRAAGGFSFWEDLPARHAGEDVLAQLHVMEHFGGCGILPSGAYHMELPTTVVDRATDAPLLLL